MTKWPIEDFHSLVFLDAELNVIEKANPGECLDFQPHKANLMNYKDGLIYWEENNDSIFYIDSNIKVTPLIVLNNNTDRPKRNAFHISEVFLMSDQLLLYTSDNSNKRIFSYGLSVKKTREIKTELTDCFINQEWNLQVIYQRVIGYFDLGRYSSLADCSISPYFPGFFHNEIDLECFGNKLVKFTEANKKLCELIKNSGLEDNPMLIIYRFNHK